MPDIFKGAAQVKIVRYSSGNTKTRSNLCSQKLVTGPTGWSPTTNSLKFGWLRILLSLFPPYLKISQTIQTDHKLTITKTSNYKENEKRKGERERD